MTAKKLQFHPLDPERKIGTVCEVGPAHIRANLPRAAGVEATWMHGGRVLGGQVGEFVAIDCGPVAILGRVLSIKLPERERLAVEPTMGSAPEPHPIGHIQLLTTIDLIEGRVRGGIAEHPRLGASVHSAPLDLIKWIAEAGSKKTDTSKVSMSIATLPDHGGSPVSFIPEVLLGRHCAILGTTGGGKSWTVSRLLEEALKFNSKVLLVDPTGEFHTLQGASIDHVHIGNDTSPSPASSVEVAVPYTSMKESDLVVLFRPSYQSQAPKLRAAMKTLKLVRLAGQALGTTTFYRKLKQIRAPYETARRRYASLVENGSCDFDITHLSQQIEEECVFPNGFDGAANCWGGLEEASRSHCLPLITRITDMITASELACIFAPASKPTLNQTISDFMASTTGRLLRVSMKEVSFAFNAREIVANTIGRHLLELARGGKFRKSPLVIVLDEAHQFLNKSIGDEYMRQQLDAFDLIAKEGRKYGLTMVMATQRPRDIPDGVLSQMGTLIVHRLINDQDREVVERASGDLDRSAAAFLPTLGPGQAVLVGVDFPVPLVIQIQQPSARPDSKGPDYQHFWSSPPAPQLTAPTAGPQVAPDPGDDEPPF